MANTATTGPASHLRAICPSAHSAVVDGKLLRAFTATRARTILAGLSPLPAGARELPTIVTGVADGPAGLCFLGQRAASEGLSVFFIRREFESDGGGGEELGAGNMALRIDDLMYEFGDRVQASARALYDLSGMSNGDMLGGGLQEDVGSNPLARLATEWDCSNHASRTLGSPPPPACSSLLLVGGTCPPSAVSLALRGDIDTLSTAAEQGQAVPPGTRQKEKGPFAVGGKGSASATTVGGDAEEALLTQQERARWKDDLQMLLSGSENMAEFAGKPRDGLTEGGDGEARSTLGMSAEDETVIQERNDEDGVRGEKMDAGQGEKFRNDLDFSERWWELAARATDIGSVRSALSLAFDAVGRGNIFPVIRHDNQTAVGVHIREGVALARESSYHDTGSLGVGVVRDEVKAWRERGSAMLVDTETLTGAFVELGIHKVQGDLLNWLEAYAGVLAADIDRTLPTFASEKNNNEGSEEGRTTAMPSSTKDRRLDRLVTLADTLDLVTLAQSYVATG